MKLTYTPTDPDDARMCEVFGVVFVAGEAEEVSQLSEAQRAKLAANPQFAAAGRKPRGSADEA